MINKPSWIIKETTGNYWKKINKNYKWLRDHRIWWILIKNQKGQWILDETSGN